MSVDNGREGREGLARRCSAKAESLGWPSSPLPILWPTVGISLPSSSAFSSSQLGRSRGMNNSHGSGTCGGPVSLPFVGLPGKESFLDGRFVSPKKVRKEVLSEGVLCPCRKPTEKKVLSKGVF